MQINWQPADLANETVLLRPLDVSDFEILYNIASDPLIWEQHPEKERYQEDVFRKFFDGAIASQTAFLIVEKRTGTIMGSTRFYDFNRPASSVAIGYTFLGRAYWGGDYNRSVKKLLLDYAFQFVESVYFHVGVENKRSIKAVMKLGATKHSLMDFEHYGNKLPHIQFELRKEDWQADDSHFSRVVRE